MRIGGLQEFTLIDYPGKIAAIIFTQGCNFRCPYCYNAELIDVHKTKGLIPEAEVLAFLKYRRKYLNGVVVTGGEPTLQEDLIPFLRELKKLGFAVKLDTNGSHPEIIMRIIQRRLVDYIAMDIKAPWNKYKKTAGVAVSTEDLEETMELIIHSGIDHQFRTTVVKSLCSESDLEAISKVTEQSKRYVIQDFVPSPKVNCQELLKKTQYSYQEMDELRRKYNREPALLS